MMPRGTYYVGDLCYVFAEDEWAPFLEACIFNDRRDGCAEGEFDYKGMRLASYNTFYGDGGYADINSRDVYSVDSGGIGCIPVAHPAVDHLKLGSTVAGKHGTLQVFLEDFETSNVKGVINIGDIKIDTSGEFDEEDDLDYDEEDELYGFGDDE